jgi:hypothetical protein
MAAPIGSEMHIVRQADPLREGAILTDVGSVKQAVIRDLGPHVPPGSTLSRDSRSPAPSTPDPSKRESSCAAAVFRPTQCSLALLGNQGHRKGDDGPHASYDSAAYKAQLEETARKPGKVVRDEGGADKAFADAAKTVTVEY